MLVAAIQKLVVGVDDFVLYAKELEATVEGQDLTIENQQVKITLLESTIGTQQSAIDALQSDVATQQSAIAALRSDLAALRANSTALQSKGGGASLQALLPQHSTPSLRSQPSHQKGLLLAHEKRGPAPQKKESRKPPLVPEWKASYLGKERTPPSLGKEVQAPVPTPLPTPASRTVIHNTFNHWHPETVKRSV